MRNNINNVVNISMMITVSLMINYLEWYTSLLMAMSVITSYVICMRASSGIRYVVQNFRLGIYIRINERRNKSLKLRSNTGTRAWRVNANVGRPFSVHRYVDFWFDAAPSQNPLLSIYNVIYHLNRNIYEGQIYTDQWYLTIFFLCLQTRSISYPMIFDEIQISATFAKKY